MITVSTCAYRLPKSHICFFRQFGNFSKADPRPFKYDAQPLAYNPKIVEKDWVEWWDRSTNKNSGTSESAKMVCLPPPNVTGKLHIGHALTVAVEDTFVRWRRMLGDKIIWIPGFDHAGIATQIVVEKWLLNEKHLNRKDTTRPEFLEYCSLWKEQRIENIKHQLNRLGASLDWSRCYYTMDEPFSDAVFEAFHTLFNQGLIFRDKRLVNWSPFLRSTLSDIEIETQKINEPTTIKLPNDKAVEVGWIYHIKYEVSSGNDNLTIATTRPETIPADVCVAVNPNDSRYAKYVGQYCKNPLIPDSVLQIIADEKVDPMLGTGVLKVTPGHDRVDFEIGCKYNLGMPNIFNDGGLVNEMCGLEEIRGLDRLQSKRFKKFPLFEARQTVLDILSSCQRLIGKLPHVTSVPMCSRTGDIVELMPKYQWFLNCKPMAQRIIELLDQEQFHVLPEFQKNQMRHWLSKSQDWCLSRQLWWGHQLPVYRVTCKSTISEDFSQFIVAKSEQEARRIFSTTSSIDTTILDFKQDDDVLDTWFSSSLVPLVVRGWPSENLKISPNDDEPLLTLMETGHDILGFWVTRMAMLGLHLTGKLPFKDILLHGIVRDGQGRKMSKSLGNVVDPLDVIEGKSLQDLVRQIDSSNLAPDEKEKGRLSVQSNFPRGIPQCGCDALRLSLLSNDIQSLTMNIDVNKIENRRHFCNKIWQGFKFMDTIWKQDRFKPILDKQDINFNQLTKEDLWILSRLSHLVNVANDDLTSFSFHRVSNGIFGFWWHELCDVYLEYCKFCVRSTEAIPVNQNDRILKSRVLVTVADTFLRLSAPFMPFLTEELYTRVPLVDRIHISVHDSAFPTVDQMNFKDEHLDRAAQIMLNVNTSVRALKNEFGIPYKKMIKGSMVCDESTFRSLILFRDTLFSFSHCDFDFLLNSELETDQLARFNADHVFYMINDNCRLYLKLDDIERTGALQLITKQLVKKKKALDFARSRYQKSIKINKLNPNFQVVDNATDMDRLETEIERLLEIRQQIEN